MSSVIVVGGGAAGMMAAIIAARDGHKAILVEKNEKLGKKLFITGKGRCNFTNAGDSDDIFNSVVTNQKFLYSAFNSFSNYDCMGFFDELGLPFKIERGNRVFPESDHSSDVIGALSRELKKLHCDIRLETEIVEVKCQDGKFKSVTARSTISGRKESIEADNIIITTGGNSYSSTGSTGDGYRFAKEMGHKVTTILPALVPFTVKEEWVKELQGLSLRNISVSVTDGKKEIYSDFGEMLFTHYGVSGPTLLSASSYCSKILKDKPLKLSIDLKPALDFEQLDERVIKDFEEFNNKNYANSLDKLLPKKMIPVIIELSGIDPDKKVNLITRNERQGLVTLLKNLTMTLSGLRGFNEAIVTQGGVSVKEVNPSTMESKLVNNVFFAGEVLDVDAVTGGFNLQIAWSTAYVAAKHLN